MFFPKKFTFLQYWLQLKNRLDDSTLAKQTNFQTRVVASAPLLFNRVSKDPLRVFVNTHPTLVNARVSRLRRLHRNDALQVSKATQAKITSTGDFKSFSIDSLHRKSGALKRFPLPESNEGKTSYQTSIHSTNSLTTPVVLGQLFSQPKPWYNYWILPFVGFITILPTLTSYRDSNASLNINNSNYGFKNLHLRKTHLGVSKSRNLLTQHEMAKSENKVPQSQSLTPLYSLQSTKDLAIFPRNLRKNVNASTNFAFFKPLWLKSNLISLPGDRVATAILQLRQSQQTDSRSLTTGSEKSDPILIQNSSKLINVISITPIRASLQNGHPYIALQDKNPTSSYKTLEIIFDSLVKQLFYSKDLSFQKAFVTQARSLNFASVFNTSTGTGTSTLLQLLQKSPLSPRNQVVASAPPLAYARVSKDPHSQIKVQTSQPSYRYLPAYQDAFYFYTYIAKTSHDVKGRDEGSPENSDFSTKLSDSIFRIKTSCFTKLKMDYDLKKFENYFTERAVVNEISQEDFGGRLGNENSIRSGLTSKSTLFTSSNTSYVQSLDIQPSHSTESQVIGVNRPVLSSTKDSEMSNSQTTSLKRVEFSKDNIQKYFHYIQSRLLLTLQSVNYSQDKQLNIQPQLVLNRKKVSKFPETQLEFVNFKPYYFPKRSGSSETKKSTRQLYIRPFNSFKLKRKSGYSQEKFVRNFSYNASIHVCDARTGKAKGSEKPISPKNEKNEESFYYSHTKQFQTLLRKAYHTQEVKNGNQNAVTLLENQLLNLKISNLNSKTNHAGARVSQDPLRVSKEPPTQTQYTLQPSDLLRLKHFIFLSNQEKQHYKHYPTLDVILKDEKLLYETLLRQNQKQKRRKKKRKRWTRRRRKRKRKLLRPIWTTIQLVKGLNTRRFNNSPNKAFFRASATDVIAPVSRTTSSTYLIQPIASSNADLLSAISTVYSTKQAYRLSKKSLVELTNNKFWKIKVKTLLKDFETVQVAKTKRWIKTELSSSFSRVSDETSSSIRLRSSRTGVADANRLISGEFAKGRVGPQQVAKIKLSSKIEPSVLLEYNRIMYERLQAFFLNYGSNIDKNSQRVQQGLLPTLASRASYSKINSFHTKILYNAPKEEWVWLFKYITGEIPSHPINSSKDLLRSLWAMSKLQSTNQWTGWKNFYYQEFKKGLTPTYELWQDKKPDKRYNVNNLKKRQYKHMKQFHRLRLSPQLHRGTYFALQRDLTKLTILGSQYKKLENHFTDKTFVNRPIDKLRLTFQTLKNQSRNAVVSDEGQRHDSYLTYQEQTKKTISNSSFLTTSKKPILDLYATWWDTADSTGWGWKTIQYGAPWDRKTLYIPSKLTNDDSIKYSSILNDGSILNHNSNWFTSSPLTTASNFTFTVTPSGNFSSFILVLLATLVFHICAFLGLLSLAEVRYSTKVNLILAYKLSAIPLKLINTVIQPLIYAQRAKAPQTSSEILLGSKPQHLVFNQDRNSQGFYNTLQVSKVATPTPILGTEAHFRTSFALTTNLHTSLSFYKYGFYGSLKQLIKKVLRQKTNRSQVTDLQTSPASALVTQTIGGKPQLPITELSKLEQQKFVLKTTLNSTKLRRVGLLFSYSTYYGAINIVENLIDYFRDTTRSVYDFFSLPENFSPNPDEVGLDVLANFIYDFEEPLIELLPDIIETQTEKYFDRYLLTLNLLGPAGLFVHQRWKWFYRMFVGLMYQADADYRKDEEEFHCLYTIWAEILNKAAEDLDLEATVIASQEDQRILLLEHLLVSNLLEQTQSYSRNSTKGHIYFRDVLLGLNSADAFGTTMSPLTRSVSAGEFFRSRQYKNMIQRLNTIQARLRRLHGMSVSEYSKRKQNHVQSLMETLSNRLDLFSRKSRNLNDYDTTDFPTYQVSKSNFVNSEFVSTWSADQYVLYKTDETDLFIEINVPKSFASIPSIKHWDTLHQALGLATCHIYSGLLTKQMAKNILLIADNTAEKTQILQALAGETEVKLIMDNSSRYASISQSVAVGMRLLRDVFDAVALQTPCIFVLEDIHLIGEKRPFLISDEDLALVTTSGLGLEQHQLYEKIQKIQQHSKHRISYFRKAYRGDAADSLPTNLLCYDLFLTDQPRTEWISPNYPIPLDFHAELNESLQGEFSSDTRKEKLIQGNRPISHLLLSETQISNDSTNSKISHFVNESILATKFDENQQKQNTSLSLRSKVSSIADGALTNISVKLDRITQLLVIMDNVRKNKGFIVFGTTNKPQILDPALRRPGRLEETIYLPSIPNILTKWETVTAQIKLRSMVPIKSGHSPITLDLFSVYTSMQKIPSIKQKNLLFTLANCIPTNKKMFTQGTLVTSSDSNPGLVSNNPYQQFNNSNYKKIVEKQTSIIKMQFINHLFIESRNRLQEDKNPVRYSTPLVPLLSVESLTRPLRGIANDGVFANAHPLVNTRVSKDPPFKRLNTALEIRRRKNFLSEIVRTSYEHIAKSLLEILTRQTSTNIMLLKAGGLQKQVGHLEDTIYRKLYSDKEIFKNDLIFVFAGIIANYFAAVGNTETESKTMFCNPIKSRDTTKDSNWQIATTLLYSYIQKRSLYNKNTYIQKLFNRSYGSISGFPGPPTTSLLLPAKRYENYLRAERDYEQTSFSQRTLSLQTKIQFHLNQRVLKRLYRLPIKEFYKSEIIENSLTTFSSSNLVLPNNTRNFAQQNMQSKTNFYYRNIFLNRHRHYLTTQWWTGHLPEYNIENTVMSEIDFRSYFVDKTKVRGFTGDLILDFPDSDQHYNLKHRRWYLQSTSWKSWYDLEKGVTTDIMNHYIVEFYTQTYRLLDNNRELLDHYVAKLLINYHLQEIELIADLKQFT